MKLLIDTNVVLDMLLRREPHYENAAKVAVLSEKGYVSCYVSASAVTDIYYIAQKELGNKDLLISILVKLFETFRIAAVSEAGIHEALDLNWDDFEDCVQYTAGKSVEVDYIVTRNVKDFAKGQIGAVSPKEFIDMITNHIPNRKQ
jgi:predicted nucleic acid-binding protein